MYIVYRVLPRDTEGVISRASSLVTLHTGKPGDLDVTELESSNAERWVGGDTMYTVVVVVWLTTVMVRSPDASLRSRRSLLWTNCSVETDVASFPPTPVAEQRQMVIT